MRDNKMYNDDFDGLSLLLWVLGIIAGFCMLAEVIKNGGGPAIILIIIVAIVWYIIEKIKRFIHHLRHPEEEDIE